MQKHHELTLKRLHTFRKVFEARFYKQRQAVDLLHYAAPGRITIQDAMQVDYKPIDTGIRLQPFWSTHWFKVKSVIPADWSGQEVHFLWDSSSEACIWVDSQAQQGLTGSNNGYSDLPVRAAFPLKEQALGGEKIEIMVEVAVNNLFGLATSDPRKNEGIGLLRQAELAVFDRPLWNLYWDFVIVSEMAIYLPQNTPRAGQALFAANRMVNTIRWDDLTSYALAQEIAAEFLAQANGEGQHQLSVLGHAHIDTAWLWPVAETKRKCVRTFSSAIRLMDSFPEFRFVCSQAQQLTWINQNTRTCIKKSKKK